MKVSALIQTPYRELPADFEKRYVSVVTPPWSELASAERAHRYYNWTIDELLHAARSGFDGVAATEHSQSVYDMMPNPNLIMAALAKLTEDLDVALIVLGTTVGKSHQPLRIAEEYALLDCLSGGRLIAGLPLGLSYDANLNYGIPPVSVRARYREAHDLIRKAWSSAAPFPWNGRHFQFAMVNLWPRPLQKPHPPVWIPGVGSPGTINWVLDNNYAYCYLSWFGPISSKSVVSRFWDITTQKRKDPNPFRLGYLQMVAVSESDAQAEADYAAHVEYFFHKCLGGIPLEWLGLPGYVDYYGVQHLLRDPTDLGLAAKLREMRYRDLVDAQCVIAGSPATVRDQLKAAITDLRLGNLLVQVQMGSMPHELVQKNIDLFAREVLPHIHDMWEADGWQHEWWPKPLTERARAPQPNTAWS